MVIVMDVAEIRSRIDADVARRGDTLLDVSHDIHAHPELNFEERHAHDALCAALADAGLDVEEHAFGLDTAFAARVGTEGPVIAVLCEYDALPEIGHACGHNVIAAAGLGAGLAAAALADELGGRLLILGTPAEEGGGGKVLMAREGAFDGVDAAMMIHPADGDLLSMDTIAIHQVEVSYSGQEAHAAAHPELGRNALDAAVLGYTNIAALRQHILPDERIHGIFTDGGQKPNIVPGHAAAIWYVRSPDLASLEPLKARVMACLSAGATAAACGMDHHWNDPPYADMIDNAAMLESFVAHAAAFGRVHTAPTSRTHVVGSTDMGNVSYLVPSIHPMIRVAPKGVSIHTPEFTRYAGGAEGDAAVIDGARSMAATIVEMWSDPVRVDAAHSEHQAATEGDHPPVM